MIRRACIIFYLLVLNTTFAFCQVSTASEPVNVVHRLFEGMEKGDSALVHSVFASHVTMATIFKNKEGEPVIKYETGVDDFLKAVGTPHDQVWYEEIWDVKIEVDGDLAQVWCNYAFFLGDKFSHCGVDAFQLHQEKNGWKIFHLADTRRKQDCSVPDEVKRRISK